MFETTNFVAVIAPGQRSPLRGQNFLIRDAIGFSYLGASRAWMSGDSLSAWATSKVTCQISLSLSTFL